MVYKSKQPIRTIAVIGSGVMGAQISALMRGSGFVVKLFDVAASSDAPYATIEANLKRCAKLEPKAFYSSRQVDEIILATLDDDLDQLSDCDLVIEAIVEDSAVKSNLYASIAPYLKPQVVLASNTSGLSLEKLAQALPAGLRDRFLGIHFFNPPRYLPLVELTETSMTPAGLLDDLEGFLTVSVGKSVVRANDTPAFIANRIGLFALAATFYYAEHFNLGFDTVDALTGVKMGRARSAAMRTADIVGLDTLEKFLQSTHQQLAGDPWRDIFLPPAWLSDLVSDGNLGVKSGRGIYHKASDGKITVLDGKKYRPVNKTIDPRLNKVLAIKDPKTLAARQTAFQTSTIR